MYKKTAVILAIFLIQFREGNSTSNKLNVEVLFESLCPDSIRFIHEQLHPVWKDLSPYVNIKLVPFGKSVSLENGTQFICQHGPVECKGNRIMSCALQRITDQNAQVEYVSCFMDIFRKGRKDENEFGQLCAKSVGLDFDSIMQCYKTDEGTNLQLQAEQSTARIAPKFIPTILYNGQFEQQLQDVSLVNFRGLICEISKKNFPEACQKSSVLFL